MRIDCLTGEKTYFTGKNYIDGKWVKYGGPHKLT